MVVYSKKQRDRAVDLYERYDFSPTAVIHELGYPSEPSLKAWHRDREHERATGEPSTRGARRRRYTDAQKRAAVDDYLVYGQINVYGVTTKSERCERSYRTRSAAGNGIGGREAPVPYGS